MWTGIVSIFPDLIRSVLNEGVVGRAISRGDLGLAIFNPRDYAENTHRAVDDRPFGGGPGMVMMAGPLSASVSEARRLCPTENPLTVYLSPQGTTFTQSIAKEFATLAGLVLVAGRYEGVDERFIERETDIELSIGDFVLSGGELAAMVVLDAVARLLPGVVGNPDSIKSESHMDGLLDFPHYTRPREFDGDSVPDILLQGDHSAIEEWRQKQALYRTWLKRPDLLLGKELSQVERAMLIELIDASGEVS
ncbi:MAG: tRNA (guanosine(37)-N1)-methyltransferase TrmD [Pseudomonadales bacterium]